VTPDVEVLSVLVVEDAPADARRLTRLLAESVAPRFRTEVCGSAAQAREAATRTSFDAILLDLGLPDASGLDSLRTVLGAARDVAVVVLTVDGREETALAAIGEGAQDYLLKGRYDGDDLVRVIRHAISRQAGAVALRRTNEALTAFAHAAAHDLRQPLRTMSGFAELLAARAGGGLGDEERRMVAQITDAARRGEELIDRLLEYATTSAGELRLDVVDLDAALDRALAPLAAVIADRGAAVTRDDGLPRLRADAVQLELALRNLVGNALKFADRPAPRIHVGARADGDGWRISVTDDGPGVPPEDRDRVFAVLARGHTGADRPGSGLGLAMVARAAERHGGHAWVEPGPGGTGSTFWISLPHASP